MQFPDDSSRSDSSIPHSFHVFYTGDTKQNSLAEYSGNSPFEWKSQDIIMATMKRSFDSITIYPTPQSVYNNPNFRSPWLTVCFPIFFVSLVNFG